MIIILSHYCCCCRLGFCLHLLAKSLGLWLVWCWYVVKGCGQHWLFWSLYVVETMIMIKCDANTFIAAVMPGLEPLCGLFRQLVSIIEIISPPAQSVNPSMICIISFWGLLDLSSEWHFVGICWIQINKFKSQQVDCLLSFGSNAL